MTIFLHKTRIGLHIHYSYIIECNSTNHQHTCLSTHESKYKYIRDFDEIC